MSKVDRIDALTTVFSCSFAAANALDDILQEISYQNRDNVAHQGDRSDHLWIVLEGSVQLQVIGIEGQVNLLASYGPGEVFGTYPDPSIWRADVQVHGHAKLLKIQTPSLHTVLANYPELGVGFSKVLARQLDNVLDRMTSQITLSAVGRVYDAVLRLSEKDDKISPAPVIATLALSVQTTRETASRAISDLIRRGIIERHEDGFHIMSRRMLEDLVI